MIADMKTGEDRMLWSLRVWLNVCLCVHYNTKMSFIFLWLLSDHFLTPPSHIQIQQ